MTLFERFKAWVFGPTQLGYWNEQFINRNYPFSLARRVEDFMRLNGYTPSVVSTTADGSYLMQFLNSKPTACVDVWETGIIVIGTRYEEGDVFTELSEKDMPQAVEILRQANIFYHETTNPRER